jgi:hypothetical protein
MSLAMIVLGELALWAARALSVALIFGGLWSAYRLLAGHGGEDDRP